MKLRESLLSQYSLNDRYSDIASDFLGFLNNFNDLLYNYFSVP